MNILSRISLVAVLVAMGASLRTNADVFRCTSPDGRQTYQETPCVTGAQKTIDDRNARVQDRITAAKKAKEDEARATEAEWKVAWARCEREKRCDDVCYSHGEALATVYAVNFTAMSENGLPASKIMGEGCRKNTHNQSDRCTTKCEDGFRSKSKRILKTLKP